MQDDRTGEFSLATLSDGYPTGPAKYASRLVTQRLGAILAIVAGQVAGKPIRECGPAALRVDPRRLGSWVTLSARLLIVNSPLRRCSWVIGGRGSNSHSARAFPRRDPGDPGACQFADAPQCGAIHAGR